MNEAVRTTLARIDVAHGHVHVYDHFDFTQVGAGFKDCLRGNDTPVLELGDSIEHQGVRYEALPTFVDSHLEVARDALMAQVAVEGQHEPVLDVISTSELVGAGRGPICERPTV